jgi:single-strand DNA-binding protein
VAYELSGKIKLIQEPKSFNSGFTKREMVVIVEDGKYPQEINIEFVQDKVGLLDNLQVGQDVTVAFDIRGREYNGRYFNNLNGWKVTATGDDNHFPTEDRPSAQPDAAPSNFDDDIPF